MTPNGMIPRVPKILMTLFFAFLGTRCIYAQNRRPYSLQVPALAELIPATPGLFLKLRKPLNDAKRLSPQLCSFAHFRVFRS